MIMEIEEQKIVEPDENEDSKSDSGDESAITDISSESFEEKKK